jgi:hypothetical protein
MKKRLVVLAGAGVVALVAGVIGYAALAPGVHVTVRNTGREPMRQVTLHVTGRSYSLGDVPPGATCTKKVFPTSESHVELELTDEQGRRRRLVAGCYFESGYRGRIDIEVKDGAVVAVTGEALPSLY